MVQQIDLKLRQMRLAGMARGWQTLNETKQIFELSLSEGLEILLERERKSERTTGLSDLSKEPGSVIRQVWRN